MAATTGAPARALASARAERRIGTSRIAQFHGGSQQQQRVAVVAAAAAAQRSTGRAARCSNAAAASGDQQQLDATMFWACSALVISEQQRSQTQQPRPAQEQRQEQDQQQGQRLSARLGAPAACAALAFGAALLAAMPPPAAAAVASGADAHAAAAAAVNPSFDLAENQEFWGNVVRYGRYFVTVMLGTGYVMVRPLLGLFKNPVTGVLAVAGIAGAAYGVKVTLEAMLGISEPFDYLPPASAGF